MSTGSPAAAQEDIRALAQKLDELNASLARAHTAHEAVRARLGRRAPPPTQIVRSVPRPDVGSGAYRGKDERAELQRAIDEAREALAELRSDNVRLEGECDMTFPDPPFASRPGGMLVIALVVMAAIAGVVALLVGVVGLGIDRGGPAAGKILGTVAVLAYLLARLFRGARSRDE